MQRGYQQGVRKKIVLDAYAQGKSIQQLVREGQDYKACHSAASRAGIRLITETKRSPWGSVKSVVFEALEKGWTEEEASRLSGMKKQNIQTCAGKLKIQLNKNGKKQEVKTVA